jgi:hypothetical protein
LGALGPLPYDTGLAQMVLDEQELQEEELVVVAVAEVVVAQLHQEVGQVGRTSVCVSLREHVKNWMEAHR